MSDRYDTPRWDEDDVPELGTSDPQRLDDRDALDLARENVLEDWPSRPEGTDDGLGLDDDAEQNVDAGERGYESVLADEGADVAEPGDSGELGERDEISADVQAPLADHLSTSAEHAAGELTVPPGFAVLEGEARGARRTVGVVVARFNADVTSRLLASALEELESCGVDRESITVMPVPGAFELPLAAMALAKTRRFACIVALGCVIRGDTAHFEFVSSETASGLQLAGIETGIPVSFGVLTLDRIEQADARVGKGAEAVRTALEMADLFANLRAAAAKG